MMDVDLSRCGTMTCDDTMRKHARHRRLAMRGAAALLCLVAMWPGLLLAQAQTVTTPPPQTSADTSAEDASNIELTVTPPTAMTHLVDLAGQGRFLDILDTLHSDPRASQNQSIQHLVRDLETYREHQQRHTTQREKNYQAARQAMDHEIQEGRLDAALVKAIDAHSHAPHGRAMLQDEAIVDLVEKSQVAAREAQAAGDWLTALTLWRNLDLLYLEDSTFHDQVQDAELHARLLRLYAPSEIQRLHIERETRRGNPRPEPLQLSSETWQERLANIRINMLYDALREAKNRHIDNPTYTQLLSGAVARLKLLVQVKGLQVTFPNLADDSLTGPFLATLSALETRLDAMPEPLSYRQLLHAIQAIMDLNRRSLALPETILTFEMADGAMNTLDPFSSVIWPHDLAQFSRSTEGRFSGVGIQISRPGRLTVAEVEADSLASQLGLLEGDLITRIGDKDTTSMGVSEAHDALASPRTAPVTLRVERPGEITALSFTLEEGEQAPGLRLSRPGRLTVVSPLSGTPAHRAGIKPNDRIVTVNNQDTTGWSLDQAVREITGPEGTTVAIGIQRPGVAEPLSFTLTRTSIEIDSVRGWKLQSDGSWDFYIDPDRQIGYIRLSQFIPQSTDDLEAAFEAMNRRGHVQGVIIDLRYNPGGLLRKAADMVDRFVRSGRIVSTVDAKGNTTSQYSARPHNTLRTIPMVVLINQGSASASEIVSGALQDYQAALIVGSRSYGKGSVQDLAPIDGGRALLKLTTQYYKLPGGRIIHRKPKAATWGIEPDLPVAMTEQQAFEAIELRRDLDVLRSDDDQADPDHPFPKPQDMFTRALDPQLEAALMYLRVRLTSDTYMASSSVDRTGPAVPPTTP